MNKALQHENPVSVCECQSAQALTRRAPRRWQMRRCLRRARRLRRAGRATWQCEGSGAVRNVRSIVAERTSVRRLLQSDVLGRRMSEAHHRRPEHSPAGTALCATASLIRQIGVQGVASTETPATTSSPLLLVHCQKSPENSATRVGRILGIFRLQTHICACLGSRKSGMGPSTANRLYGFSVAVVIRVTRGLDIDARWL